MQGGEVVRWNVIGSLVLRLAVRLKYLIQFAPSSVSLRIEILQSSLDPVPKYRLSPASRFRVEKNVTENVVGVTSSLSFGDKSLWPFHSYYPELKAYTVWGKDCIFVHYFYPCNNLGWALASFNKMAKMKLRGSRILPAPQRWIAESRLRSRPSPWFLCAKEKTQTRAWNIQDLGCLLAQMPPSPE